MRRLREHHFKDVCCVSNAWLRLILLQNAYAVDISKIRDKWIECFGPTSVAAIMKPAMEEIRTYTARVVRTFRRDYAALAAYDHKPEGFRVRFLGRLGFELGKILLNGTSS